MSTLLYAGVTVDKVAVEWIFFLALGFPVRVANFASAPYSPDTLSWHEMPILMHSIETLTRNSLLQLRALMTITLWSRAARWCNQHYTRVEVWDGQFKQYEMKILGGPV